MTIQKALKSAMKHQKMTQLMLSKLSRVNQSTISTLTKRGGSLELYLKLFDELGFEVCIRPKHRGNLSDDHFVLSAEDEQELIEPPKESWYATETQQA